MSDRLHFYSNSADKPPGQGVHEQVSEPAQYAVLARVRDWRKMLSNFWVADFTVDGLSYRTVEHRFQAAKIALVAPPLARQFALESGSDLARGDGLAARKQRKMVMLDHAQLAAWDAVKHRVMQEAMLAKFSTHEALRAVLVATSPAELWHTAGRGVPPERILDLEAIRTQLSGGKTGA